MEFVFAGGAMEVGGSCIYMKILGHGILLDSGIRQGTGVDPLPDFRTIQEAGGIEAIIVSHAHMDHTGSLPVISKAYPNAPIFMTSMTLDLTRVLLYDSLKIMGRLEDEIPLFTIEDVELMLGRIRVIRLLSPLEILPGIKVTFHPAGHIAGAACTLIQSEEGTVFYSGDVSVFQQRTIEGAKLPALRPDVVICESTYGNRLHGNRQAEEQRLVMATAESLQKGGKVLIPAFALGRSQEVLLILREAIQNKAIPAVPVYVDGMVRDICRVYKNNEIFLRGNLAKRIQKGNEPFFTKEIQEVKQTEKREDLLAKDGPAIFVSSSGMLTGGPSVQYAEALASQENATIMLTGYQDEESPGRELLNLIDEKEEERLIHLNGKSIPVKCRVIQVGLSAHADKSELIAMIDRLAPRHVVLVHGDEQAIDDLGNDLAGDYRRRVYRPMIGEKVEIVLKKKREQLRRTLEYSLNQSDFPDAEGCERLWTYWNDHLTGKSLTMEETTWLWFGKPVDSGEHTGNGVSEQEAGELIRRLIDSPYFERDYKRMYLIRCRTKDEVDEETKEKAVTIQDVEAEIRELLPWDNITRISFYNDRKEAVINVDFPDAASKEDVKLASEELQRRVGYTLSLGKSMNFNEADRLLYSLFGAQLDKISYYTQTRIYEGTLYTEKTESIENARQMFEKTTGWKLVFRGEKKEAVKGNTPEEAIQDEYWTIPEDQGSPKEQNAAMKEADFAFDREHRPYKISVRNDTEGPYFDVSYITPEYGLTCKEYIQQFANASGWRVHIAQSVNQGELMRKIDRLCMDYGIRMTKNPSILQGDKVVRIVTDQELPEDLKEEVRKLTGFELSKKG